MKKIIICICTYNRNKNLIECLESIKRMKLIKKFDVEILIIDNTIDFKSKKKVEKYKKKTSFKINIINEKKRGIVYARNSCLDFIKNKKTNYISFIDDDCIFDKNWIVNAFKILKKYNADIVTGPQNYSKDSNKNINFTKFFEKKYNQNILKVNWAATNNILFKSQILEKNNLRFDKNLNKFGMGEDQLFFLRLSKLGKKIFYSKEIKVTESIHKHRLNIQWLKNRSFRLGVLGNYIDKKIYGNILGFFLNYLKFIYYFLLLSINLFLPFQKNFIIKINNYLYRSLGKLLGPFIFYKINFLK